MKIGMHKYYKRLRKTEIFNYEGGKKISLKKEKTNVFKGTRFNFDR